MTYAVPHTLFCLPFLGGSARGWGWLADRLPGGLRCVGIDLPGFGDAAHMAPRDVAGMADHVAGVIAAADKGPSWAIAGHSMGAKVALAIARRAEDGDKRLVGLSQLVLLAGSPPCPEPMEDAQRSRMLEWFAGPPARDREQARGYIDDNVATPLPAALHDLAVADVLCCARPAWMAWLEAGSREDWSGRIGMLRTPTLVLAGSRDEALGPATQRALTMPHLAHGELAVIEGAGHLLPLERPAQVARLIVAALARLPHTGAVAGLHGAAAPVLNPAYAALIDSDRVSPQLRDALHRRAQPDDPGYTPAALDVAQLATLRAVLARVIPQPDGGAIDLAARLDRQLATGPGDGWRFADLPADRDAYVAGLRTLELAGFARADAAGQDRLLHDAAAGTLAPAGALLGPAAMALWFEDLRAAAVQLYMAHPATLARIGYSGIANGGVLDDAGSMQGFTRLGMNEREPFEPLPAAPGAAA